MTDTEWTRIFSLPFIFFDRPPIFRRFERKLHTNPTKQTRFPQRTSWYEYMLSQSKVTYEYIRFIIVATNPARCLSFAFVTPLTCKLKTTAPTLGKEKPPKKIERGVSYKGSRRVGEKNVRTVRHWKTSGTQVIITDPAGIPAR